MGKADLLAILSAIYFVAGLPQTPGVNGFKVAIGVALLIAALVHKAF